MANPPPEPPSRRPELAVIIPAWNERENLEILLPGIKEELAALSLSAEIVIIDHASSDGTRESAERKGARVIPQQEPGYGGALLAGFAATTAPYIVTMDADLSHRPFFLAEFWKRRDEAQVIIASRYIEGGRARMGWFRRLLSRALNGTCRRVLSLPISDLSSGFRMYHRNALTGLTLIARDYDILEEILVRVHAEGWQIKEVPFAYTARGSRRSRLRLVTFGWAFLRTLARMWHLRNSIAAADYDYRAFDSWIWLQRYWQRTRHRIISGFAKGHNSILDIGCGSSRIILDLPSAIGMDILENKLRWLKREHRLLVKGSCESLPFRNGHFSAVICSEVIEHVPDTPHILQEMRRVLKPGGKLILGTPDYDRWLWLLLEWVYGIVHPGGYAEEHITHFTYRALRRRLQDAGFEIDDCRYVGFCEMIFQATKMVDARLE